MNNKEVENSIQKRRGRPPNSALSHNHSSVNTPNKNIENDKIN